MLGACHTSVPNVQCQNYTLENDNQQNDMLVACHISVLNVESADSAANQ
jgi:hypothetical protein